MTPLFKSSDGGGNASPINPLLPAADLNVLAKQPPEDASAWTPEEWARLQRKDPFSARAIAGLKQEDVYYARRYTIDAQNLLFRRVHKPGKEERRVLVVPESLRTFVLHRFHSLPITGHKGANKTISVITARYYWPGLHKDVRAWIKSCASCQRRKAPRPIRSGNPGTVSDAKQPWDCVSIDLVEAGSTSSSQGKYILTMLDTFSRYTIAVPLRSKKAEEVADALFTHLFAVHGRPRAIRSDEGKEFVNSGLTQLYRRWRIQPVTTGGYRPWSNPVERFHRYLNSSMTMLSTAFGDGWERYLPAAVFSYNASVCRSTGYSPHHIIYGKEPTLLEDVAMTHPHEVEEESIADATARMTKTYEHVRAAQAEMTARNRAYVDNGRAAVIYKVNDPVYYWEPAQRKKLHQSAEAENGQEEFAPREAPRKWKDRWTGPHIITEAIEGAYDYRYTFTHARSGKLIANVKPDRLTPFVAWNDEEPSTSPELDRGEPSAFERGTPCAEGSMAIIPLQKPWPFGLAKILSVSAAGDLTFQWYTAKGKSATTRFLPMWESGRTRYNAKCKSAAAHKPYTNAGEGDAMAAHQRDVVIHGFQLTPTGYLPKDVLDACREEASIWWPGK